MISVEHLTKYYGTTCAVDDVSFTIGRGEVAALLGPNGSGKSTLMRVLTGYFPPTAGRVCIDGADVAEQPAAARRRIGYLPEQVSLYPELTVRRYLAFVAEDAGAPAAPRPAPARATRLMPDPRRAFPLAPLAPPRVDDLVHDDDGDAEQRDDDDRFPERHRGLLS